jgi:HAD superfamily hydrolase (TIGR01484 family)
LRPLSDLPAEAAQRLSGVIFDLDDTLLDHGALTEAAYASLFTLRRAGLRLIACTGRPAGWGEVIARLWPLDAAVAENGAIAFVREESAPAARISVVSAPDGTTGARQSREEQRARRSTLLGLALELVSRFPDAALADDNDLRVTDVTIDIGEHRCVRAEDVRAMRAIAAGRGVRTLQSSVHLHLTTEAADKASGSIHVLCERFGEDATRARATYAFVGDSGNDAAPFAAFAVTFGVANVRPHLGKLSIPPRYISAEPMGRGFAAIAARLTALRGTPQEKALAPADRASGAGAR